MISQRGESDLYVRDVDGDNLVQLTHTREAESCPAGRRTGARSVLSRASVDRRRYSLCPLGRRNAALEHAGVSNPTEPDWSPDGKWIAFTSQARDFSICIVDVRGGPAMTLVSGEDPSGAQLARADFLPAHDHAKVLSLLDVPTKHVKDIAVFKRATHNRVGRGDEALNNHTGKIMKLKK